MYCAEAELRTTVQLFEPLPSQLAYPDLLERAQGQGQGQEAARPENGANTNTAASRLLAKGRGGRGVQEKVSDDMPGSDATRCVLRCLPLLSLSICL
jgi:hypothetical protein